MPSFAWNATSTSPSSSCRHAPRILAAECACVVSLRCLIRRVPKRLSSKPVHCRRNDSGWSPHAAIEVLVYRSLPLCQSRDLRISAFSGVYYNPVASSSPSERETDSSFTADVMRRMVSGPSTLLLTRSEGHRSSLRCRRARKRVLVSRRHRRDT